MGITIQERERIPLFFVVCMDMAAGRENAGRGAGRSIAVVPPALVEIQEWRTKAKSP